MQKIKKEMKEHNGGLLQYRGKKNLQQILLLLTNLCMNKGN
jgi:hypothetical protein